MSTFTTRRQALLALGTLGAARGGGACGPQQKAQQDHPRQGRAAAKASVLALDAFAVFSPRSLEEQIGQALGDATPQFLQAWRERQFAYTWWLTAASRYEDFHAVTLASLRYANVIVGAHLPAEFLGDLAGQFFSLPSWPEVPEALELLLGAGFQLALLSNFTRSMLRGCLKRSNLERAIPVSLSAETVRAYKPAPAMYRQATDHYQVGLHDVFFVAAAPWDALGAAWFGYETAWVNRLARPPEELAPPVASHGSLLSVAQMLTAAPREP